jgi:hypothetical protein
MDTTWKQHGNWVLNTWTLDTTVQYKDTATHGLLQYMGHWTMDTTVYVYTGYNLYTWIQQLRTV